MVDMAIVWCCCKSVKYKHTDSAQKIGIEWTNFKFANNLTYTHFSFLSCEPSFEMLKLSACIRICTG